MTRHSALLAFGWLGSVIALAQAPPSFDAASIRPNPSQQGRGPQFAPGRFSGTITATKLILEAYNTTYYQLSGGPGWLNSDAFDIVAKAATPANKDQLRPMLQTLLAERFKLVVHHETKEMPVYALTVGKNGPKLRELKDGDPRPSPSRDSRIFFILNMREFAEIMNRSDSVGRPVLDKTGLDGVYVMDLEFLPNEDFVTMVQEQSGLKFESQTAPMDTLVIDHIEKPDPN